ncbi:MAG TPA: ABC transporter ATP-binding protein [Arthrobacter sp.]|nr:ABC transporter ATP-binding protein [Arthrobacter sp.]
MIQAQNLTKRYGSKLAVDNISFTVHPGRVTGFLGPNGAGKSTTMRMALGLDAPSGGSVTVNGKSYPRHHAPLHEVGALLDAKAVHTSRSAYNHLLAMATTHGISGKRVKEVIEMTGLGAVANKRVGGFSLGMGQRLGIAVALLGNPQTVILDEPVNGLDPEGVLWVRNLARQLANEGKTVFLSSHLMSEMSQTADHLIVIGRGRIIADAAMSEVLNSATQGHTRVRADQPHKLQKLLVTDGARADIDEDGGLDIYGPDPMEIARTAMEQRILIYELAPRKASLEEAYMELTKNDVEYHSLVLTGKSA